MPEIQSPDPGRKLQERYNLIGSTPAPFLSPELVPVVLIDDLTEEGPGPRFCSAASALSPAAGKQAATALGLPNGANVLIENISVVFYTNGAASFEADLAGPTLTGSGATSLFQDRRLAGSPIAIVSDGDDVGAVSGPIAKGQILGSTVVKVDLPNWKFSDTSQEIFLLISSINISCSYFWTWTERVL